MIIITWEDYKKEMPQIHLQSVFSISLFLKQKVTTQAYNKNFQMHALSKNPRKCFIFSIDSPFKFRNSKIRKKKIKAQSGTLDVAKKKHPIHHALKTSICSFQISCHFNPTSWRQKKKCMKRERMLVTLSLSRHYCSIKQVWAPQKIILSCNPCPLPFTLPPSTKGNPQESRREALVN